MTEQWQKLKETIIEMRDNGGTGTQEEVCIFLVSLMEILEKQMQESTYAKGTIIKSALKYLVKRQIEEGSVGFAVDNDHDHDCCWDDVLAWIEPQTDADCISRDSLNDAISELTYWHFEDGRLVVGGGGIKYETVYKVDDVVRMPDILPPVTPQASEEDIHREREQAYMLGYEDASKRFRTETPQSYKVESEDRE